MSAASPTAATARRSLAVRPSWQIAAQPLAVAALLIGLLLQFYGRQVAGTSATGSPLAVVLVAGTVFALVMAGITLRTAAWLEGTVLVHRTLATRRADLATAALTVGATLEATPKAGGPPVKLPLVTPGRGLLPEDDLRALAGAARTPAARTALRTLASDASRRTDEAERARRARRFAPFAIVLVVVVLALGVYAVVR